jgi:hypothetical protein
MKLVLAVLALILAICDASASAGQLKKLYMADSSDACLANCASQNASCKRVCPTTFSTPCLSSCDSQMQICTQGCRTK